MIFDGATYRELTAEEIAVREAEQAAFEAAERSRPLTAEEVTALLIRQQINTLSVDDNTALRMREFYPVWEAGQDYPVYSDLSDLVGLYVEKGT